MAAEPAALEVTTRVIEVNGKPVKTHALNASGTPGLSFVSGDAFKVRLYNRLSEPTLVHWRRSNMPERIA